MPDLNDQYDRAAEAPGIIPEAGLEEAQPRIRAEEPKPVAATPPPSEMRQAPEEGAVTTESRWPLGSASFWIFFLVILAGGGALRTWRMDAPPIESPGGGQPACWR